MSVFDDVIDISCLFIDASEEIIIKENKIDVLTQTTDNPFQFQISTTTTTDLAKASQIENVAIQTQQQNSIDDKKPKNDEKKINFMDPKDNWITKLIHGIGKRNSNDLSTNSPDRKKSDSSTNSNSQTPIIENAHDTITVKKENVLKILRKSILSDGSLRHHAPQKSASLDSIPKLPSKSILKKRELLDITDSVKKETPIVPEISIILDDAENEITEDQNTPEQKQDQNYLDSKREDNILHSSVPNLPMFSIVSNEEEGLRKTPSTKSITFNIDNITIIDAHGKSQYNRKPDNNVTFKKLTPKLKMEIRDELNQYKRNEMSVHSESIRNTAFH